MFNPVVLLQSLLPMGLYRIFSISSHCSVIKIIGSEQITMHYRLILLCILAEFYFS